MILSKVIINFLLLSQDGNSSTNDNIEDCVNNTILTAVTTATTSTNYEINTNSNNDQAKKSKDKQNKGKTEKLELKEFKESKESELAQNSGRARLNHSTINYNEMPVITAKYICSFIRKIDTQIVMNPRMRVWKIIRLGAIILFMSGIFIYKFLGRFI